jgi:hypothetical protein
MRSLIQNQTPEVFSSRLDIPPPPACLGSPQAMRDWLMLSAVTTKAGQAFFGYTVGTIASATSEDRDKPRFIFDEADRYLGLAAWLPDLQGWSVGGQVGELKTLVRVAGTVSADLESRPLAGWKLADGTAPGVPDLTPKPDASPPFPPIYFQGTAPDWGLYTVAFTG